MVDMNLTEIVAVIDRSGSMSGIVYDVIGGFNSFINEQRKEPGRANVTVTLFDNMYEILYSGVPLLKNETRDLLFEENYYARGWTALYDALGRTMNEVGARFSGMPEKDRPGRVIFLIITDGRENGSREFNLLQIKKMISHQREKYNWEFVFLGANIDAFADGRLLGTRYAASWDQSTAGVKDVFRRVSASTSLYRSAPDTKLVSIAATLDGQDFDQDNVSANAVVTNS